jgi:hypothetical protein
MRWLSACFVRQTAYSCCVTSAIRLRPQTKGNNMPNENELLENVMLDDDDKIKIVANGLLNAYVENTKEGTTSLKGLLLMKNIMDSVFTEFRGQVFASFLTLLQMNSIPYDPKVFQANPSEAIH